MASADTISGWILDFPDGEGVRAPTPTGGAPTYYFGHLVKKTA